MGEADVHGNCTVKGPEVGGGAPYMLGPRLPLPSLA